MVDFLAQLEQGSRPLAGFRYPLLGFIVALAVTWFLTPLVRKLAFAKGAVDDPKRDDRRIHTEPLPRWGGIAIYLGIVASLCAVLPFAYPMHTFPLYLIGMLLVGGVLVAVGALDDLFQYSAKVQLLLLLGAGISIQFLYDNVGRIQMGSLGIPLGDGKYLALGLAAIPLTAIYIFIITKTMDTIDGVDGLAAGIATISASTLFSVSSDSDVIAALTSYIDADPEARAWLDGAADPWGMRVNPNYKGLVLPVNSWPVLETFVSDLSAQGNPCLALSPVPYLPLVAAPVSNPATVTLNMQFQNSNSTVSCQDAGDPNQKLVGLGRQSSGLRALCRRLALADTPRYDRPK